MNFVKLPFLCVALASMTLLAGCGICGCTTDPNDTPVGQSFTYNGNSWRVADIRDKDKLVITAVDPKLAGLGTEAAARHPIGTMPEAEYRAAAAGWFATTGRFCTPGPAEPLNGEDDDDSLHTGYQYHYSCWTPA